MYAAKAAGRRTYRFFDPAMEQQANHRRELEADLRAALAEGAFELHYQPQVDLCSDRVTGCEALLRWRHPVRGMVSPADFVPVAEETGLIGLAGRCPHRRQRLADSIPIGNAVAEGRFCSVRDRARPAPAGAGDHRSRPDRGR
jgi:predicted signal transduction protein with EAL and GGDEF domain